MLRLKRQHTITVVRLPPTDKQREDNQARKQSKRRPQGPSGQHMLACRSQSVLSRFHELVIEDDIHGERLLFLSHSRREPAVSRSVSFAPARLCHSEGSDQSRMLLGPSLNSACRMVSFSNGGGDISASWDHDDRHTCDNVLDGIPMSMCIDAVPMA